MKRITKLFGDMNMSWKKVIAFSVVAGVYTSVVNQIPFLAGTSFRDIAVTLEWWILFAVIIAVNSKSSTDAALKIFAFFMISQPIVFLVELPMLGLDKAWMYYSSWIIRILLTLPGGFIAYYAKKDNWLGAVILSVATSVVAMIGFTYVLDCMDNFPVHLLTVIFCIAEILLLTFMLKKKTVWRVLVLGITVLALIAAISINSLNMSEYAGYLPEGNWTCITKFDDGGSVQIRGDDFVYEYNIARFENKEIVFENENGERIVFVATKENGVIDVVKK